MPLPRTGFSERQLPMSAKAKELTLTTVASTFRYTQSMNSIRRLVEHGLKSMDL